MNVVLCGEHSIVDLGAYTHGLNPVQAVQTTRSGTTPGNIIDNTEANHYTALAV